MMWLIATVLRTTFILLIVFIFYSIMIGFTLLILHILQILDAKKRQ
ncbi:hypothetical protein SAMN02746066_00073 [Anaerosporobacter mobilis DSM 15930]|uniref:Uncharacterized protein n=1 Tax=Anaerosporobacter mobilis DSM 15930 TaxID=1120996 RepID=A0A1M7EMQ9_9FIRM|nr:hypothetical protein SAMN02746066_00073 [Anaerosporobacter mobilis DSM 15930]